MPVAAVGQSYPEAAVDALPAGLQSKPRAAQASGAGVLASYSFLDRSLRGSAEIYICAFEQRTDRKPRLQATSRRIREQNIPHRPAYPAGSAGYIALAIVDSPVDRIFCTACGAPIAGDDPRPCLACGSTARTIEVSIVERAVVRDGYEMKGKRPGMKRPFLEDRAVPSFSVARQKLVHHERLIDRENDHYFEKVTDYESSEVIHHQEEPLSDHFGHGSAKPKSEKNGG